MIVDLPTGRLQLQVNHAAWPLDALCDFAARDNPRRGFLIVSRLLGRHIGAQPSTMRAATRDLAGMIPADLPGPVLVFGMAETAICLGQMVHEDFCASTGRDDVWFLHSTRQQIDAPLLCRFEEPHSHASAHLVYRPEFDLAKVQSLVMVDDEISTGTTLSNLAGAIAQQLPAQQQIIAASLIDWSGEDAAFLKAMPRPARSVSLLGGSMTWQANSTFTPPTDDVQFERAARSLGQLQATRNFGRRGLQAPLPLAVDAFSLPDLPPASRIRVVGTGEFSWPAFKLGEALEAAGHDVTIHTTTRSPALLGHAMQHRLCFADNYGTGVANYVYNLAPEGGAITLITHETPPGSVDPALVAALSAHLLPLHCEGEG